MTKNYTLSPCVQSAVSALPPEVTAWEFAKHLILMHPEYTESKVEPFIGKIDQSYEGKTNQMSHWLDEIAQRYPNEELIHTQLVILALYLIDSSLKELIPSDAISIIQENITLK